MPVRCRRAPTPDAFSHENAVHRRPDAVHRARLSRVIKIFLRPGTIAKIAFKPRYAAIDGSKLSDVVLRASASNSSSAGAAVSTTSR